MTDVFFYHIYIRTWFESLSSAVLLMFVNLLIRKYGKKQADELKNSNLLVLACNINIIITFVMLFVPYLGLLSLIKNDYLIYKIFYLIVQLIVPISSLITLGIFMTIFGKKNSGNIKNIPIATGISILISYFLQIITTIIYVTYLIDYSIYNLNRSLDIIWSIYMVLVNLSITAYLFGIAILFGQSRMNDLRLLSFAMFLMLVHFVVMTNLPWILRSLNLRGGI